MFHVQSHPEPPKVRFPSFKILSNSKCPFKHSAFLAHSRHTPYFSHKPSRQRIAFSNLPFSKPSLEMPQPLAGFIQKYLELLLSLDKRAAALRAHSKR